MRLRRRLGRRRRGVLFAGGLLAAFVAGALLLVVGPGPRAASGSETQVQIPRGAGVAEAAQALRSARVIRSALAFQVLARTTGAGRSLKAGEYAIPSRASMFSILSDLEAGRTIVRTVTLPEGLTSAMIVRAIRDVDWLAGDVDVPAEGVPASGDLPG